MNKTTSSDGESSVEFLPWERRNRCKYDDFNINLACTTEDQLVPTITTNEGIDITSTGNSSNTPVSGPTAVSRNQEILQESTGSGGVNCVTKDTDDQAPALVPMMIGTKKRRIDNVGRGTTLLPTPAADFQLPRESTKISNSSSLFNCPICLEKFDSDITAVRDKRQSKLPVMSASCAHKVCCECLVDMQLSWSAGSFQSLPKWLKCPVCKQKTAFNALDMPVDSFACECIRLCTSKGSVEAEPTHLSLCLHVHQQSTTPKSTAEIRTNSGLSGEVLDLNLKMRDLEGQLKCSRSLNSTNEARINSLAQQLREKDELIARYARSFSQMQTQIQNLSNSFQASKAALEHRCKMLESEKATKAREVQELIEQQKKDTQLLNSLVDLNNKVAAKLRNEAQKETEIEAADETISFGIGSDMANAGNSLTEDDLGRICV